VCVCVCVCVCVSVALGTQHAKRMRLIILSSVACPSLQYFTQCPCAILSSVACPSLQYFTQCPCAVLYCHLWRVRLYNIFPHCLINGTIFGKKVIEHKVCVFIFSRTSVWNISHPSWSQWPRGLTRGSASARLMRLWVQILPVAWMFVVSIVYCQVEVSASGWSLVQRSPADCGAS
jgi:hypothetical protein